jgi:hypothetical protein
MLMGEVVVVNTVVKGLFIFGGTAVSSNYVIDEVTGVSPLKEYGKNYFYGEDSFLDCFRDIYDKIKDNNSDRFRD